MKTCPVCSSTLFDDMPTCFGCLYQFGSNLALETSGGGEGGDDEGCDVGGGIERSGVAGREVAAVREMNVPGWVVRVRAEGAGANQTSLAIEIEPACEQAGSVEQQVVATN